MKFSHTAFLLTAFAMVTASLSQTSETTAQKVAEIEGITEYRLGNGCRVLLFPDQSKPEITVNMTIFVGSRHEGYGETGMAHLLEHLMFKGTPTNPRHPQGHERSWCDELQWNDVVRSNQLLRNAAGHVMKIWNGRSAWKPIDWSTVLLVAKTWHRK